ncbi:nicotinate-nucleotide--dimethylbenzimidazole phosphoribosyltransferase [Litoribrevibacter albus]|uniref:Nicotinate-nucleotide--dimethylbenzimidazole phosphoribosyltransferase n=1 Tax=Litoribrevibacter albus TaxID=1473156 RepID=A0AA37W6X2_9GAMM|nr:nicotinate-nucleotide--dimethylbenzimidazole phosphoribosyltransferase [Litoribrevibacter albus]GLQ29936.1 nicotinate-nucleotide--dimethylbenzimidazole phosphoribosyltransferase [Litoribrevibacter albus]
MTAWWTQAIQQPNAEQGEQASAHQNQLTKPPGSLGQLEDIAIQLAANQNTLKPKVDNVAIRVFAGDHGVVEEGVSAFPQAVTVEMIKNFCAGGAAISVLAKEQGADFQVVNVGTATPVEDHPKLINQPVAAGTQNFCQQAAMTEAEFEAALGLGKSIAEQAHQEGAQLFIGGEMGIGNTTAASAVAAALIQDELTLEQKVLALVGRGTGVDDKGLTIKQQAVMRALALHQDSISDPVLALQAVGGLEIVALTGAYLRCGQLGVTVLVDGFICSVAALAALSINEKLRPWLIFAHQSEESGHQKVLQALDAKPLLNLGMRLGEASGAAVALPLLRLACSLHSSMATFESAGVSNSDD